MKPVGCNEQQQPDSNRLAARALSYPTAALCIGARHRRTTQTKMAEPQEEYEEDGEVRRPPDTDADRGYHPASAPAVPLETPIETNLVT